jgi:predicted deacetylase
VSGRIAVAVHDVEPASFELCRWIRDWLCERGIDRATLLVIPATRLHQFQDARPELAGWLHERRRAGDTVAQHGFQHLQNRRGPLVRGLVARLSGSGAGEFAGLDAEQTANALEAGRKVLARAGIAPAGFVAPAYVYTPQLRRRLAERYSWWAGLWRVYARDGRGGVRALNAPALCLGTSRPVRAALSPTVVRARARVAGGNGLLRLDVHPADVDRPRHLAALERVLELAQRREAVTYDAVAAALVTAGTPAGSAVGAEARSAAASALRGGAGWQ